MTLPDNPYVYIVLIFAVLIALVVALRLRANFDIEKTEDGWKIRVRESEKSTGGEKNVTVAKDAKIKKSKIRVIAGGDGTHSSNDNAGKENINVANGAEITDSEIEEIIGKKEE